MGVEELKLRATFWNNLSVGLFLTGVFIPVIWVWIYSERTANASPLSSEALHYYAAITIALAGAFSCRRYAIEYIRKADGAVRRPVTPKD
ncbi:hypothetical protein QA640_18155 [Bradyrhizobium sp. CB82]|uniref:hypothetical protein n=1 Tax=Bradyrhizobium sp. CB82 TaxID=3039159 RepID=UPI0024B17101|nr:hypothetical protein [Bradyrhizobium sp. CB82]WFU44197.1 hypothetical protein QA640_18155 [Bradyrhizobium sp. CB82]